MIIRRKAIDFVYAFKCHKCGSEFEMTEKEREENDWNFTENREKKIFPHNFPEKFNCPVCNNVRYMRNIHKYVIFEDGSRKMDY